MARLVFEVGRRLENAPASPGGSGLGFKDLSITGGSRSTRQSGLEGPSRLALGNDP